MDHRRRPSRASGRLGTAASMLFRVSLWGPVARLGAGFQAIIGRSLAVQGGFERGHIGVAQVYVPGSFEVVELGTGGEVAGPEFLEAGG